MNNCLKDEDDQLVSIIEELEELRLSHEIERDMASERGDDDNRRHFHGKVVTAQTCIDIVRRAIENE